MTTTTVRTSQTAVSLSDPRPRSRWPTNSPFSPLFSYPARVASSEYTNYHGLPKRHVDAKSISPPIRTESSNIAFFPSGGCGSVDENEGQDQCDSRPRATRTREHSGTAAALSLPPVENEGGNRSLRSSRSASIRSTYSTLTGSTLAEPHHPASDEVNMDRSPEFLVVDPHVRQALAPARSCHGVFTYSSESLSLNSAESDRSPSRPPGAGTHRYGNGSGSAYRTLEPPLMPSSAARARHHGTHPIPQYWGGPGASCQSNVGGCTPAPAPAPPPSASGPVSRCGPYTPAVWRKRDSGLGMTRHVEEDQHEEEWDWI